MNRPYHVIKTEKVTLSDLAAEIVSIGTTIRLFGDRTFHFSTAGEATTDDTPVAAEHAEFIGGGASGSKVSVVRATGETDGSLWASHIQFL